MELEEQTKREVAHRAARKWHDVDDDDQKIAVKREEATERGRIDEPKPRIGAKDEKQASRTGDAGEREGWRRENAKSREVRRETEGSQQCERSMLQTHEAETRSQPAMGSKAGGDAVSQ